MDHQMFTIRDVEEVRRRFRLRTRKQSELRDVMIAFAVLAMVVLLREAYLRGWM